MRYSKLLTQIQRSSTVPLQVLVEAVGGSSHEVIGHHALVFYLEKSPEKKEEGDLMVLTDFNP